MLPPGLKSQTSWRANAAALTALCALLAPCAEAESGRCPDASVIVRGALNVSPVISQAAAERDAARAQLLAERSNRWPQVGIFGETGIGNRQPLDQLRDDQVGVSANLDITTFGRRGATIRAAKRTLRAAESGEIQARMDIAETALILYTDFIEATRLVGLRRKQVRVYTDEALTLGNRIDRGLITRSDAGRIRARLERAKAELSRAALRRDDARTQIFVFTGVMDLCGDVPNYEEDFPILPPSDVAVLTSLPTDEAWAAAQRESPDVARAKEERLAASARLKAANRAGLPTVSANAFVLGTYNDSLIVFDDRWQREERFGFSLQQQLFTGGRLRAEQSSQRAAVRAARAEEDRQQQLLLYEVERSIQGVNRYTHIVAQHREALNLAKETLNLTQIEVSNGSKRVADLVLANDDYVDVGLALVSAQAEQHREQIRLARATSMLGRIYDGVR